MLAAASAPYSLYELSFPNGKIYLGISVRPKIRWEEHMRAARRGSHLPVHKAIRKYGWASVKRRVLVVGGRDYIADLEVKAIAAFGGVENGYNIGLGGTTSPTTSPSVRKKMIGRKHTPESCAKRSETCRKTMDSVAFRKKRSEISKAIHTPEMVAKKAASVRAAFQDPAIKERHRLAMIASHAKRKSPIPE